MIRVTVYESKCPYCGATFSYQGNKRFGAPEALCGKCKKTIRTGQTEWSGLSQDGKIWVAVKELLLPSFIRMHDLQLVVVGGFIVLPFLWMVCTFPFIIPAGLLSESKSNDPTLSILAAASVLLGICVYPGLLLWRLRRLISQSNAFTNHGVVPVLRASGGAQMPDGSGFATVRRALLTDYQGGSDWGPNRQRLEAWMAESTAIMEPHLLRALTDPSSQVRHSSIRYLRDCEGPAVVPALERALQDPDQKVRESAAKALEQIAARSAGKQPAASSTVPESPADPAPAATPPSVPDIPAPAPALVEAAIVEAAAPAAAQRSAEPAALPQAPKPVPVPAATPVRPAEVVTPSVPVWAPSHRAPAGGMAAWARPDPSQPPVGQLPGYMEVVVEASHGPWALVRIASGWRGWVDGRYLLGRG